MSNTPNPNLAAPASAPPPADSAAELTGSPVTFRSKLIDPPSQLYIKTDDNLLVTVYNSQPLAGGNITLTLFGRILEPSGRLVPFEQQWQVPGQSMPLTFIFGLAEGFLMGVSLGAGAGGLMRGQVYATIQLVRGGPGHPQILGMLAADYVTFSNLVAWPFGGIVNPLAGHGAMLAQNSSSSSPATVPISFQPFFAERRAVRGFAVGVTTSSVVGNRFLQFIRLNNSAQTYWYQVPVALIASSSATFTAGASGGFEQSALANSFFAFSIPSMELGANEGVQLSLAGAQAGDTWNFSNIAFEQWVDV